MSYRNQGASILFVGVGAIIVATMIVGPMLQYKSTETITITPTKMDRECKSNDGKIDCRYVIYAPGEVFVNEDAILFFKFNSSDIQNDLQLNKPNKVKVAGWRIPFFSMYRNILEIVK